MAYRAEYYATGKKNKDNIYEPIWRNFQDITSTGQKAKCKAHATFCVREKKQENMHKCIYFGEKEQRKNKPINMTSWLLIKRAGVGK